MEYNELNTICNTECEDGVLFVSITCLSDNVESISWAKWKASNMLKFSSSSSGVRTAWAHTWRANSLFHGYKQFSPQLI